MEYFAFNIFGERKKYPFLLFGLISLIILDPAHLPEDSQHAQNLIFSLQVLEVIAGSLHPSLQEKVN